VKKTRDWITWLPQIPVTNSSFPPVALLESVQSINSQAIILTPNLNRGKQHSTIPEELCTKELLVTCSEETAKKFKKLPVSAALVRYSIGLGVNILSFLAARF
jgi:hypothetical protein